MLNHYQTVRDLSQAEYEVQKSLFIAYVAPAKTEEEAQSAIQTIKKRHYDATHHCFAYTIGLNDDIQKADDDGEPSGTAGRPILEVLKKNDMKNIVLVVTRFFGGIKLGAGGLTRAYSKSASLGLQSASIQTYILSEKYKITVDYLYQGPLENQLLHANFSLAEKIFTDQATFSINILPSQSPALFRLVNESTRGTATIEACGNDYVETTPDDQIKKGE